MSIWHNNRRIDGSSTVGAICLYAGSNVPSGWLPLDGRTLESLNPDGTPTEFMSLYQVLGNKYGQGTNIGSFKLPNMQERFAEGSQDGTTLGTSIDAGLPTHNHTFTGSTSAASGVPTGTGYSSGSHSHTRGTWDITGKVMAQYGNIQGSWVNFVFFNTTGVFSTQSASFATFNSGSVSYGTYSFNRALNFAAINNWTGSTSDPGNHSHSVTAAGTIANTSGSIYGGSTVQPATIVMQYIIKYK